MGMAYAYQYKYDNLAGYSRQMRDHAKCWSRRMEIRASSLFVGRFSLQ